jgi:hypothetical protein
MSWRLSAINVTKPPNIPGINGPFIDSNMGRLNAPGSFEQIIERTGQAGHERMVYIGLGTGFAAVSCDDLTREQSHTAGREPT